MTWLLVAVFGAIGAPSRYVVDRYVQERTRGVFPWGTFVINVSGAFVLGLLTALEARHHLTPDVEIALGVGFCGAFTTWSTYNFESVRLLEDGALGAAAANAAGSLAAGVVAAAGGLVLGML